jgi:hypothetical protein
MSEASILKFNDFSNERNDTTDYTNSTLYTVIDDRITLLQFVPPELPTRA